MRLIVGGLAALRDDDAALKAAHRLILSRGHRYADVLFEPNLALADDLPGYAALVNGIGLSRYWRGTGQAPDICRDQRRPSFCAA